MNRVERRRLIAAGAGALTLAIPGAIAAQTPSPVSGASDLRIVNPAEATASTPIAAAGDASNVVGRIGAQQAEPATAPAPVPSPAESTQTEGAAAPTFASCPPSSGRRRCHARRL